ncbi:MAG: hypothetical protein KF797_07480 [Flavobacteriales bacterium]|nr:hypothetical protein [Flavobacteriales bacterium]
MKGVRVLFDEVNQKRVIQIDVEEIDPADELLEDLVDTILAEQAKDDEKYDWEDVKRLLKKEGKL